MRHLRFVLLLAAVAAASMLCCCGDGSEKNSVVATYKLGESITLGHINYTVYETQWLTQLGTGAEARMPQHRFFLVRLKANNALSSDVILPNLSIEDDNGHIYQELNSGDGVPQYIGYLRSVRPNDSRQGNALFDAPAAHYKIKLTDDSGEKAAYVDLPLNFSTESVAMPDTPISDKKK
jgi:hypothetical protein